jgi:hypothetical protein
MSDTPLRDAVDKIPKNELRLDAEADKLPGHKVDAGVSITLEREKELANGSRAIGVTAGASTSKGGYVAAFFRRVWK